MELGHNGSLGKKVHCKCSISKVDINDKAEISKVVAIFRQFAKLQMKSRFFRQIVLFEMTINLRKEAG